MNENKNVFGLKSISRKEYGKYAIIGLLSGALNTGNPPLFVEVIVDVLVLTGIVCGIIWIYKTFRKQS